MIQTPSEMMRDLIQKTMDNAGFQFNLREEDLLYGVPGAGGEGRNTSISVEIKNQPVKPRDLLVCYNRLDLEQLTVALAPELHAQQLPATVHEALPILATYLRIRLGPQDVEDAPIPKNGDTAIITLVAKPDSLAVTGAVEIDVRPPGGNTWII